MENNKSSSDHFDFATRVGLDGYSAYKVATEQGFTGSESEWIESLKQPAVDAATNTLYINQRMIEAENGRMMSEIGRVDDDTDRKQRDMEWSASESSREVAEALRYVASREATAKSNKAAEEALEITSALSNGNYIAQELISPYQGKYTSISTPMNDSSVKWSGSIAPIGTDNFTIQFCGAFDNSSSTSNCAFKLGTNLENSNIDSILIESQLSSNNLDSIWFPPGKDQISTDTAFQINHTKAPNKPQCIILGRDGNEAFVYANGGDRKVIRLETVMAFSNLITISNASRATLLRKFNFAIDDALAKSLYNGGRWHEKSIERAYLNTSTEASTLAVESTSKDDGIGGSISTISSSANCSTLCITTTGVDANLPTIRFDIPKCKSGTLTLEIDINIPNNGVAVAPRVDSGGSITPANGYTIDEEIGSGSYILTYDSIDTSLTPQLTIYTDGRSLATYAVKKASVRTQNLDNEYLPNSITKTKWIDTRGGADLLPSNVDKMLFNTEPTIQDILYGEGIPTYTADVIGQQYVDTLNRVTYRAYGTKMQKIGLFSGNIAITIAINKTSFSCYYSTI